MPFVKNIYNNFDLKTIPLCKGSEFSAEQNTVPTKGFTFLT